MRAGTGEPALAKGQYRAHVSRRAQHQGLRPGNAGICRATQLRDALFESEGLAAGLLRAACPPVASVIHLNDDGGARTVDSRSPENSGKNDIASTAAFSEAIPIHTTGRLAKRPRTRKGLCPQERTPAATLAMTMRNNDCYGKRWRPSAIAPKADISRFMNTRPS
jgi:hypothetical protein